jgi:hypothetical protein
VQRFCNALPPVPACTAPYRLVPKIRHFVAILPTVHSTESHPVAASSVGNPVGNMPIHAWETCDKSMVLTAYRAFDLPRGQPSQRHNPGNPPRSAKTERHRHLDQRVHPQEGVLFGAFAPNPAAIPDITVEVAPLHLYDELSTVQLAW